MIKIRRKKVTQLVFGATVLVGALASASAFANPQIQLVARHALQKPAILSQYSQTANQLSLAQLQTALIAEKAEQVGYQLSITKDDHEIKKLLKPPHQPIFVVSQTPSKPTVVVLPTTVNWVMKRGGQWMASLEVNGQVQTVKQDAQLSNGASVLNINTNGVLIEKKGRRHFIKVG